MDNRIITESQKYPLNAEPKIMRATEKIHRVFFGNTGLRINVMRDQKGGYVWLYHFTPNGIYQPEKLDDPLKDLGKEHVLIFGHGMNNLVNWWRDSSNWEQSPFPKLDQMTGLRPTPPFFHLLKKLFGESQNSERYEINLKSLSNNEPILSRLRRLSEQSQQRNIVMDYPFGPVEVNF